MQRGRQKVLLLLPFHVKNDSPAFQKSSVSKISEYGSYFFKGLWLYSTLHISRCQSVMRNNFLQRSGLQLPPWNPAASDRILQLPSVFRVFSSLNRLQQPPQTLPSLTEYCSLHQSSGSPAASRDYSSLHRRYHP